MRRCGACRFRSVNAASIRQGRGRGRQKIEFEDPHATAAGLNEAEVTRVRTLKGFWRWTLIVATALTIFLCINQQFALRFFVSFTQLNTEYFYLLIALHAPLHLPDFPGDQHRLARPHSLVRPAHCS